MIRRLFALLLVFAPLARAAEIDDANALYDAKRYPEARVALEKIAAAQPQNAAAAFYLGQTLMHRGDPKALEDAVPWLEKATVLDPKNANYFNEFGDASLTLASNKTSLSAANKGREALEKCLQLDPENLDARDSLYQFYSQAPWPISSTSKAAAQLEEVRKRDPDRAMIMSVVEKVRSKDYAAAFKICEEAIAKNPANYMAHYQYGRTSAISEQNLELGITHLQKCLTLKLPGAASPTHSYVWKRIGNIQEKLKHRAEAIAAYENALKLDASNQQAADALAKLK
jgi:tetratricopeptide (TPR) repeat protein